MAQARVPPARSVRPGNPWSGPLVVGLCCALGYGITQRLQTLAVTPSLDLGHRFDTQPFPGTSLESLRMRYGASNDSLRGDPNPPAKPTPAARLPESLPGPESSSGAADPLAPSEPAPVKAKAVPSSDGDPGIAPLPPLETPAPPPLPEAAPPR